MYLCTKLTLSISNHKVTITFSSFRHQCLQTRKGNLVMKSWDGMMWVQRVSGSMIRSPMFQWSMNLCNSNQDVWALTRVCRKIELTMYWSKRRWLAAHGIGLNIPHFSKMIVNRILINHTRLNKTLEEEIKVWWSVIHQSNIKASLKKWWIK